MSGYPIRMAVLVDFSDGAQHEYEVRGPDTVDAPSGATFWPAAVVSTAMREQITREQACTRALSLAECKLSAIRDWATHCQDAPMPELVPAKYRAVIQVAADAVLRILDAS